MATEKLIISLEANTQKLNSELKKVDSQLNSVEASTNKADKGFSDFSDTAIAFGGVVMKAATAVIAVKAALDAMVLSSAQNRMELEQLSRQAKLTTGEFQALSFAAKQYGVTGEQVADISKDIADRLGEFATAGTGTFQDFLDVMGMTKQEGQALAKEFQTMSSDQVIGQMVKRMEEAGASGNQMTFVLESMGNDLSKLSPLFADNGKELKALTGAYKDANSQMAITAEQADELKKVSTSFDLMTAGISNATTAISATLAPSLNEFFNSVIEIVPDATQKIIDFINSFQDASNIKSLDDIGRQIDNLQERAAGLEQFRGVSDVFGSPADIAKREELMAVEDRLNEMYAARLELQKEIDANKLAGADRSGGGEISGTGTGANAGGGSGTGGTVDKELQAVADKYKSEEELLRQKLNNELAIIGDNEELVIQAYMQFDEELAAMRAEKQAEFEQAKSDLFWENLATQNQEKFDAEIAAQQELLSQKLINEEEYLKAVNDSAKKYGKIAISDKKTETKKKEGYESDYAMSALQIGEMLFEGNKALEAGLVVAKTGAAVMHQLGSGDPYTAFARAGVAGAIGAVQLAQTLGASKGGGSISAPSQTSAPSSENTNRVSSSVEINESISSGSNQQNTSNTVTITADDGDELATAFANMIQKKITNGELKLG